MKNKDNVFRVRDFTSSDNVDISRFDEVKNKKGEPQLQAQVCVLYPEEYHDLITSKDSHESEVQRLKAMIEERESQIMKLKKQVNEKEQGNSDEVMQLKEEISIMKEDHHKEVSKLHQDLSDLEKSHIKEVEELKETHTNQLLAIDETRQKESEKLNEQYNAKLDEVNDKLLSEVQANKQASQDLKDEVITLQKQHHDEIVKLQHAHSNELQAQQKQHEYDITRLKEANNTMKQENLTEINKLEQKHRDEIEKIKGSFLGLLANEHAKDLSDFNDCGDLPFYIKPFSRRFLKQFDEFKKRKYMNTPQTIVETYELESEKE